LVERGAVDVLELGAVAVADAQELAEAEALARHAHAVILRARGDFARTTEAMAAGRAILWARIGLAVLADVVAAHHGTVDRATDILKRVQIEPRHAASCRSTVGSGTGKRC